MNCQMWPFTDVRVRRAFNHAINREKLVKLLNGRGVAARGVLPPNLPGADPAAPGYQYDPGKARSLLEDAGVRRGYAPELWLRADQTALTLAQSIQQDLALVGIEAVLKPLAWGPLLEAIRQPRTAQLFQLGWEADFPDPDNFLNVLLTQRQWGANNDTFYYNPRVDGLIDQAAPLADLARRYELYREAERIVMEDAPWVPLYNPVTYAVRQAWVRDYQLNPIRPARFERVWLQKPAKQEALH
jgi:ABC-type transport system substrate-binding protein